MNNSNKVFLGSGKVLDRQPGYEPITVGDISLSVVKGNSDTPVAFSDITGDITEYFLRIEIKPYNVLSYRLQPGFKYLIKKSVFKKNVAGVFIQPAPYLNGATLKLTDEKYFKPCLDFLHDLEAVL